MGDSAVYGKGKTRSLREQGKRETTEKPGRERGRGRGND